MKKSFILSGIFVLLFLTGCGSSVRVIHDLDPEVDFSGFRTYSFLDWTDGNKRTITGMELDRIRVAMARELESRGLTFAPDDADVKVKITVYFRDRDRIHYHYRFPAGRYSYIERALAVDLFEGTSKKHIWHSAAIGEAGRTPQQRYEDLPGQVARMFEDYPVRKNI